MQSKACFFFHFPNFKRRAFNFDKFILPTFSYDLCFCVLRTLCLMQSCADLLLWFFYKFSSFGFYVKAHYTFWVSFCIWCVVRVKAHFLFRCICSCSTICWDYFPFPIELTLSKVSWPYWWICSCTFLLIFVPIILPILSCHGYFYFIISVEIR